MSISIVRQSQLVGSVEAGTPPTLGEPAGGKPRPPACLLLEVPDPKRPMLGPDAVPAGAPLLEPPKLLVVLNGAPNWVVFPKPLQFPDGLPETGLPNSPVEGAGVPAVSPGLGVAEPDRLRSTPVLDRLLSTFTFLVSVPSSPFPVAEAAPFSTWTPTLPRWELPSWLVPLLLGFVSGAGSKRLEAAVEKLNNGFLAAAAATTLKAEDKLRGWLVGLF